MKSIANLKALMGGLCFLNALNILTVIGQSYNTTSTRYLSIVNVLLAVVFFYFAFKVEPLVKNNDNFVYFTVWFGLVYTIIVQLFTVFVFVWATAYLVVSILAIYYLRKTKRELAVPMPTPMPPTQA